VSNHLSTFRSWGSRFTLDAAADVWRNLEPRYKQSFVVLMAVNLLVFSYGMMHHAVGDHDLLFFNGYHAEAGYQSGRWFQGVLSRLTFKTTEPVYIQLLTIVFQVLAAMGMIILWRPKAGARELILGGLVVCLLPFVNWHHYYRSTSYFFSFPQLAMVLALILSVGADFNWKKTLAAAFLVMISLATYNPAVQTYAVGWAGLLCLRLARWDGTGRDLGFVLKSLAPSAAAAVVGGLLYYATTVWMTHKGLMAGEGYLSLDATRSPAEMLAVMPDILGASFRHLRYSQQFMPGTLKSFLLLPVYLGLGCLAFTAWRAGRSRPLRLLTVLAAVVFLIFCSKLAFVFTQLADHYAERIAQMSLSYVYLFFVLAALSQGGSLIRELTSFFLILAVLPCMAVYDLRAQETFVLLARHDFAVANRALAKMESRLGAGLGEKQYVFVQLGAWKPLNEYLNPGYVRIKPYQYRTIARMGGDLVFRRLSAEFEPKAYYTIASEQDDSLKPPDVVRAARLSAEQKPFPDDGFIGVYGDLVVLLFDTETRDNILRQAGPGQP
jgi:hypothetical protein